MRDFVPSRELMTKRELASRVFEVRKRQQLTQEDIADRLGKTIQAVSKAENFTEGDGMTGFRIKVLNELTDEAVVGPLYAVQSAVE